MPTPLPATPYPLGRARREAKVWAVFCAFWIGVLAVIGCAMLAGCDSPGLRAPSPASNSARALAIPQSLAFGAEPLPIVPCLYQADPPAPAPAPAPQPTVEPAIKVTMPQRSAAGLRKVITVEAAGIPDALPLRWRLPDATITLGMVEVRFADECVIRDNGRVLEFAWPVAAPLAFRVTAGIAVRDKGEVIGFDVVEREFTFTQTTLVPVPPSPGPGPGPPPPPIDPTVTPLPTEGLRVLIVSENEARSELSPQQAGAIFGTKLAAYLNANCVKVGGKPEWRILDPNAPMEHAGDVWVEAMKRPRAAHHWLLVSNGKAGWEGPLPKTYDEIVAIIERVKRAG